MKQPNNPYDAVGQCIYCGIKNEELTKEHIVPFGLGGNLTLPEASCKKCAKITSQSELVCLRVMFGLLRQQMRLPTRHSKKRPDKIPLEIIHSDGVIEWKDLSPQKMPKVIYGWRLPLPGILRNVPPSENVDCDLVVRYRNDELEKYMRPEGQRVKVGSFNLLEFCRMIAKIAHAYAVAQIGIKTFRPLVTDLILGKSKTPSYWVGGDREELEPIAKSTNLHDLRLGSITMNNTEYVFVSVRLFAFINMPTYYVVVGEKTSHK